MKKKMRLHLTGRHSIFDRFAGLVTRAVGSSWAFLIALATVVVWGATGPVFQYSETWQLIINTGTTIVTFLMVFVIQRAQNKDSAAVHVKLNELLASHEFASNRIVSVENLDESDLETLRKFYCRLAALAEKEGGIKRSHSVDEAEAQHQSKTRKARKPKRQTKAA